VVLEEWRDNAAAVKDVRRFIEERNGTVRGLMRKSAGSSGSGAAFATSPARAKF
jgi:hypothetical protein